MIYFLGIIFQSGISRTELLLGPWSLCSDCFPWKHKQTNCFPWKPTSLLCLQQDPSSTFHDSVVVWPAATWHSLLRAHHEHLYVRTRSWAFSPVSCPVTQGLNSQGPGPSLTPVSWIPKSGLSPGTASEQPCLRCLGTISFKDPQNEKKGWGELVIRSQGREKDGHGLGSRRQGGGLAVWSLLQMMPTASLSQQLPRAAGHHPEQLQYFKPHDCQSSTKAYLVDKSAIRSLP